MDQGPMIRAARGRLRMTQSALALAAGVSVNTVKRAESGLPVQDETIRGLCSVLGMDVTGFPRVEFEDARADGPDRPQPEGQAAAAAVPIPWFGGWAPPKAWVRPIFVVGIACLIGTWVLAAGMQKLLGGKIAFAPPPEAVAWLNPVEVNVVFLSLTLFAMMLFTGAGIVCGVIESSDEDLPDYLRTETDEVRTVLACVGCFGMSTPIFDGWSVFQFMAVAVIAPPGEGVLPWLAGWPLIAMQVYLLCVLTKLCGPFLRVPPMWPFGLTLAFLALARPTPTTPIVFVAGALVAGLTVHVAFTCSPLRVRSVIGGARPE